MVGDVVYLPNTHEEMNPRAGIPGFQCCRGLRIETLVSRGRWGVSACILRFEILQDY